MKKISWSIAFCFLIFCSGCAEKKWEVNTSGLKTVPKNNAVVLDSSRKKSIMETIKKYFNFHQIKLDTNKIVIQNGGEVCTNQSLAPDEKVLINTRNDTMHICQEFTESNIIHECGHLLTVQPRYFTKSYILKDGTELIGVQGLVMLIRKNNKDVTFSIIDEAACEFLAYTFAKSIGLTYTVPNPRYIQFSKPLMEKMQGKSDILIKCMLESNVVKLQQTLFPNEKVTNEVEAIVSLMDHFHNADQFGQF